MKKLMERNSKGEVKMGKTSFKIPKNQSAISIIGNNSIVNCSEYRQDGWVYVDGKKLKKWFMQNDSVRFWEPILKDIAKLEKRYWKQYLYMNKYWNEVGKPSFNALVKVKQAHAFPSHAKDSLWLYTASNSCDMGWGISFEWVNDPKPKKLKNVKIGQKYLEVSERHMDLCGRVGKFRTILDRAISNYLWSALKPKHEDVGKTLQLIINDRHYLYYCGYNGSLPVWNKVHWPSENGLVTVEIK